MRRRQQLAVAAAVSLSVAALGCEADEDPATSDPDGLDEPADDPEGAPDDGEEAESDDGAPAVEGDGEGRLDPDSENE